MVHRMLISVTYAGREIRSSDCYVTISDEFNEVQKSLYNNRNSDFQPEHETRMQCVGRVCVQNVLFEQFAIMTDGDFGKNEMARVVNNWKATDTTQPFGEWFDCAMLEELVVDALTLSEDEITRRIMAIIGEFEDFMEINDE